MLMALWPILAVRVSRPGMKSPEHSLFSLDWPFHFILSPYLTCGQIANVKIDHLDHPGHDLGPLRPIDEIALWSCQRSLPVTCWSIMRSMILTKRITTWRWCSMPLPSEFPARICQQSFARGLTHGWEMAQLNQQQAARERIQKLRFQRRRKRKRPMRRSVNKPEWELRARWPVLFFLEKILRGFSSTVKLCEMWWVSACHGP